MLNANNVDPDQTPLSGTLCLNELNPHGDDTCCSKIVYTISCLCHEMSRNERKHTFWHVRQTNTQISLRIRAVWSESSLSAWSNFASLAIRNAPSEDSDQAARMRRLIWIFAWRTCSKVRFLTFRFKLLRLPWRASCPQRLCKQIQIWIK